MDVLVGIVFLALLLLLVYCALKPGFDTLRLEAQRQEQKARTVAEMRAAETAARYQVEAIITRYGQLFDQLMADDTSDPSYSLEVLMAIDLNYPSDKETQNDIQ